MKLPGSASMLVSGTLLSASSQLQQGRSVRAQLRQQAGQTRASAQVAASAALRQAKLMQSRALAVAAASGGGIHDPTVQGLLAQIGAKGQFNALASLYQGEEEARGMEFEGQIRMRESRQRALSSVLSTGTTFWEKYGDGLKPKPIADEMLYEGTAAADYALNPQFGNYA